MLTLAIISPIIVCSQVENLIIAENDTIKIDNNSTFDKLEMQDNSVIYVSTTLDTISITAKSFHFGENCEIYIEGEHGIDGHTGISLTSTRECKDGKNGGHGSDGTNGEDAPVLTMRGTIHKIGYLNIVSAGGSGGDGGDGGKGERGGNADDDTFKCSCDAGAGGNGGNGGNSGAGGAGSDVIFYYDSMDEAAMQLINNFRYSSKTGSDGRPGRGGDYGQEGPAKGWCEQKGRDGSKGNDGKVNKVKKKSGRVKFQRFTNKSCEDRMFTHTYIISAFENEQDPFFKAKIDLMSSIKNNLANVQTTDLSNLTKFELISFFDSIKDGTIDEINDLDETQILFLFIGHGFYDEDRKSMYFLPHHSDVDEKVLIDDIITRIEKSPFKNKLTILNSCSSGTIVNDYPFSNTKIFQFNPFTMWSDTYKYSCWGTSSTYITSSFDKERSSKTAFIYGIIHQINTMDTILSATEMYSYMMRSEFPMNGVRPVIGRSNNSEIDSNFLFIKK